jgi:hypothetical protein
METISLNKTLAQSSGLEAQTRNSDFVEKRLLLLFGIQQATVVYRTTVQFHFQLNVVKVSVRKCVQFLGTDF